MQLETGRAQRSQTRLSFDADMGELWEWYVSIPERARPREVLFLVQVGFAAMKGLTRGGPAQYAGDGPIPAAHLAAHPVGGESQSVHSAGPTEVEAVRQSLDALGSWGSADPGFETVEAET